ncbi:FAD-dependent oxidoreductase [Nakamurella sp. DB0629]|uniref:FAD-dependent oxidoreductase n=1 Tax=Nakamurella aerolata TaxID=1656892 RepID=A0A849A9C6_9ACTN|nr:FAD-dependent oxidoreductase [Nakamurella aerolata]
MQKIVVIGAGVAGVSLADALTRQAGVDVTVLDRDAREPRGSTP